MTPCSRSAAKARERPRSAVKTIATQSNPLAASSDESAGQDEVEDDERREDEEEHRRQRVARAQLEQEVLARERSDVGEVVHASASFEVARRSMRAGSCVATTKAALAARFRELAVEQRRTFFVEAAVRLVEDEQVGIVQQRAAESEALQHPARVRVRALVPCVPEPEALEQHADALAPLGDAVEPAVEVEVLERGQLAVDERLVPDVPDAAAFERERASSPAVGTASPAQSRSSVVLPEPLGPVTSRNPSRATSKPDAAQNALVAVPLLKPPSPNHEATVVAPGIAAPELVGHGRLSHVGDCPRHVRRRRGSDWLLRAWSSRRECDSCATVDLPGQGDGQTRAVGCAECHAFLARSCPTGSFTSPPRRGEDGDLPRRQRPPELPRAARPRRAGSSNGTASPSA